MEMVNAGIIPATVTITQRAKLWANAFHDMHPQPDIIVGDDENLAWAMRKNNPKFKDLVDEFTRTHAAGTSFGNTLMAAIPAERPCGSRIRPMRSKSRNSIGLADFFKNVRVAVRF